MNFGIEDLLRFAFFGLICIFSGCSYTADFIADYYLFPTDRVRPPSYSVSEFADTLTTTDGVKLRADIYIPDELAKAPTVLVRIPFTKTFGNQFRSVDYNITSGKARSSSSSLATIINFAFASCARS